MMIGVRHALGRACLGILFGIGIVAVLVGLRRSHRHPALPAPAADPEAGRRRRGPVLALVALLLGIGLIAVVSGGALRHPAARDPAGDRTASAAPTAAGRTPEARTSPAERARIEPGQEPGQERGPESGPTPAAAADPTFDIVRVEPNGDAVVAGRAAPNGTVELLVDGKPAGKAVADADGRFAFAPAALPAGNSEVGLRATDRQGRMRRSADSVAVVVAPSRDARPLVALSAPGKPTVVLSHPTLTPDGPEPEAETGRATARGPDARDAAGRDAPDANAPGRRIAGRAPDTEMSGDTPRPAPGGDRQGAGGSGRASPSGVQAEPDATAARPATGSGGTAPVPSATGTTPGATAPAGALPRPATTPAPVKIVSIDAQDGGRLYVSGRSVAGSTVRLYLNDTLVAAAGAGRDGSVTFTIGRGVKSGTYAIRLDQVDAATGKVLGRVEVPFSMPASEGVAAADPPAAGPADAAGSGAMRAQAPVAPAAAPSGPGSSLATAGASQAAPGDPSGSAADGADVFVPEIATARIVRGDSLWQISRRVYGAGDRYTVIYDANQDQIRNPDLIYPGQIFVLPSEDAAEAGKAEKRG